MRKLFDILLKKIVCSAEKCDVTLFLQGSGGIFETLLDNSFSKKDCI